MIVKNKWKITGWLFAAITCLWLCSFLSSCGKAPISNPNGLNVKYQILNLSPDAFPVDLYIRFLKINTTSYTFNVNQGYFYLPYLDTPFLIRSSLTVGGGPVLVSRHDVLKTAAVYSLFITGNVADNSLTSIFTVDTSSVPALGRGKVRFVNASPTGTGGIDVYANGVKAFSKVIYPKYSDFIELPNGYYDFQINTTGSSTILQTLPKVQIQDGRLYTLYSYGYTNRTDSAAFNTGLITNR
ncbi:DUF4397 domain-containing protein [Mucilaginibacter xinganensis]|uniref:DUF4397 domain-containing protein n=1 Tax=Mucilaginibacter xinganensis TaxID=1234841 RepID=A0A223NTN2_9SPHI|nr:DUF4397 domain-containing protein [Mucilaginibacter xinganensis]ASU33255.1 hypothetical protein MuYL_1357 [Mucilaginibacter xinganensis]